MQNIQTELLRAFVTVIDLKGFTRAGERLGRSQPAISLQIKRLQDQVGHTLFDRDGGGSTVTGHGRLVETYARRILALNDELLAKIAADDLRGCIRIGVPLEYADPMLTRLLSQDWARNSELTFDVVCDIAPNLMVGMHEGSFDFVFTVSDAVTEGGLNSSWLEPMVWVGKPEAIGEMSKPLRLLAFAEGCPYRALMKDELTRADMPYEVIYTSQCLPTLRAALNSGFGITVLPERAVQDRDLILKGNSRLPKLPELRGAIYLAGRMASPDAGPLATRFAQMVNTSYLRVA